jgi:PadR family transcriptional regulator AphA
MKLSNTAPVILGMLAMGPRSGYEIKQFVDKSTRFFWAASYGQIYPELKRLAEAGLVTGSDASQGARQRTVYELTAKGKRALREWLEAPAEVHEMRDEGLLKLFFAGAVDPAKAPAIARRRAAQSADVAARLREIESAVPGEDTPSYTVLRFGIEMNEWIADWFDRAADSLERDELERVDPPRKVAVKG